MSDGSHPHARLGAVAVPYLAVAALFATLHLTGTPAPGERSPAPFGIVAAHVLPVALLLWRARWASIPLALLSLLYLFGPIAGTALAALTLFCVFRRPHRRPPELASAALILGASTLHLAVFGYSDAWGSGDLVANTVTMPGVLLASALGVEPLGEGYTGTYPPALLAVQLAANLALAVLLILVLSRLRRRRA